MYIRGKAKTIVYQQNVNRLVISFNKMLRKKIREDIFIVTSCGATSIVPCVTLFRVLFATQQTTKAIKPSNPSESCYAELRGISNTNH